MNPPESKQNVPPPQSTLGRLVDEFAKRFKRSGRLGPLTLVVLALPAISGVTLLTTMEEAGVWLRGHQANGIVLFVGLTAVLGAAGILPTAMLCLLGGWSFGFLNGSLASYAGILLATLLGHALASWLAGNRLFNAIGDSPKALGIRNALAHSSVWRSAGVISLIRVSPVFPFAATNLLLAASKVRLPAYVMGTAVGLLPRSTAVAYIGSQAKSLSDGNTDNQLLTWMGIVTTILSLAALVLIVRRVLSRLQHAEVKKAGTVKGLGTEPDLA